jgi:hypothetical protein
MRYTKAQPISTTTHAIATPYQRYFPIAFKKVNNKAINSAISIPHPWLGRAFDHNAHI